MPTPTDRRDLRRPPAGLRLALGLIGALAISLHGCGSSQGTGGTSSTAGAPAAGTVGARLDATPSDHDAYGALGYRLSWRGFAVMSRRARVQHVEFADDALLVQDTGNVLTLLESGTGRSRWSTTLGADLTRFVGVTRREKEVLAASDTDLYYLDIATGVQTRRDRLAVVVNTAPVVMGEVAVFGCTTGEILGHSLYTGFKLWGYGLRGAIDANPARVGDLVGVVSQGGEMVILNPQTGTSTGRGAIFGGLGNNPVGDNDGLYMASLDQSVYAFGPFANKPRWRHRTERPITEQPTIATVENEQRLFVAVPGVGLRCFDAVTGDVVWTAEGVMGEVVALRDGKLLVWRAETSQAGLLDTATGDALGSVALPGVKHLRTSAFTDGDLYLVTSAGVVSKLVPKV